MLASRIGALFRYLTTLIVVAGLVWAAAVYGERALVRDFVMPLPGTQLDVWLGDFTRAATYGVGGASVGTLLWYICTEWFFSVQDWRNAGRRGLWAGIGVVTLIVCTAGSIYVVPPLRTGGLVTYTLFGVNAILVYYLVTVFATPPSYKYTPLGSNALRVF